MKTLVAAEEKSTEIAPLESTPSDIVKTDDTAHARLGWWVVIVGFGGFLLWAFFAPLDKGVPLSGTVIVSSHLKAVQHQTGGTIDKILVQEGETVKAGQVLVVMNDVQVKAQAEITRGQLNSARAVEARLIAERDNATEITFPPSLLAQINDPQIANTLHLQNQLFTSRKLSLQHELAAGEENAAGLKVQLQGLQALQRSNQTQLSILDKQLNGLRELAEDGFVPRNRVFDQERTYAQLTGEISENNGNIGRIQRQIAELSLLRVQRLEEYQKEVRQQLSDIQREEKALNSQLVGQDFELANVQVKAPVDGIVVGMDVFTQGGVIGPGFRMMDIVPIEDSLVITGEVPVHLIDKVHPGLHVDLIFSAFNQNKTPN
ncbi:MAG: HlyD family type I secretion periplasmic adaptor subunit, partial [Betaproteobacteria bacterium]|nr:HlyD family type I secretion periplasmic adaptor subunit [Betaproteobacteria bacterium]